MKKNLSKYKKKDNNYQKKYIYANFVYMIQSIYHINNKWKPVLVDAIVTCHIYVYVNMQQINICIIFPLQTIVLRIVWNPWHKIKLVQWEVEGKLILWKCLRSKNDILHQNDWHWCKHKILDSKRSQARFAEGSVDCIQTREKSKNEGGKGRIEEGKGVG